MTDLVSQNVEVILNRKTNMEAVIKIIEENIPEVMIIINAGDVFDVVCWKISDKLFAVVMVCLHVSLLIVFPADMLEPE